ncbi:unnamed protein product [Arctia plantaginis]|uniref:Uncharacterized protein n=1 Tax=Arctia plantaginis TaxID=874455 RepID=A0A8S1BJY6_ARCPL|nr:unnamed protein product [Arctia plantaginis]
MTTPGETLDLSGISAVLTGQKPLEQYDSDDAGVVAKQISKKNPTTVEPESVEDCYPEGYDPDCVTYSPCSPLICHDLTHFDLLNTIILNSEDPLANSLLQTLRECVKLMLHNLITKLQT